MRFDPRIGYSLLAIALGALAGYVSKSVFQMPTSSAWYLGIVISGVAATVLGLAGKLDNPNQ